MLDNPFLQANSRRPLKNPGRVYMRLDHREDGRLAFDAVDADFFDRLPPVDGIGAWTEFSSEAPVFVVEVEYSRFRRSLHDWDDTSWWYYPVQAGYFRSRMPIVGSYRFSPGTIWFEALFNSSGRPVRIFRNLFQEAANIGMYATRYADPRVSSRLDLAFSLDRLAAPASAIKGEIRRADRPAEWVAVYDVGQGNANGVCDGAETPLLYFDLGGGVNQNAATFPTTLTDFCYARNPPVVLSHWDWDHWSSGARFTGASKLKWIVPNQWLGGVHATFAAGLHAAGNLFVWPRGLGSVSVGQITILRCTGRGKGRNHTGLAIEVAGPNGQAPILLAGDARYSAIPGSLARTYTSLVVPHHGADMRSARVPRCAMLTGARTALSYGDGNTWNHPAALTIGQHHGSGWTQPALARHTRKRVQGLGHIGLSWNGTAARPGHSCSQAGCAVGLRQT